MTKCASASGEHAKDAEAISHGLYGYMYRYVVKSHQTPVTCVNTMEGSTGADEKGDMPMVSLKLMAGAARSMVVASARTTLDGRRMCEPMKRKPRRPHDRSAGLFLVRFGIALIDYRNGMQHAKRANGTSRTVTGDEPHQKL